MGGGDEGNPPLFAEAAAQKGGNPGVGVDHVGSLAHNHLAQDSPGRRHIPQTSAVKGGLIVADARRSDFRHIYPAVGDNSHVMPLVFQLLGQLYNVGLRPADVQAHGSH